MSEPRAQTEEKRLAVIVTDVGAAVNGGGGVSTTVRLFDLPPEARAYIAESRGFTYCSVTLAVSEKS